MMSGPLNSVEIFRCIKITSNKFLADLLYDDVQ